MRRLLTHEEVRRAAADEGAALVNSRFRWSVVVSKLVGLYDEVLREPRGHAGRPA